MFKGARPWLFALVFFAAACDDDASMSLDLGADQSVTDLKSEVADAAVDASIDAAIDASIDAAVPIDASVIDLKMIDATLAPDLTSLDSGRDAGSDGAVDGGSDGSDGAVDGGHDVDASPQCGADVDCASLVVGPCQRASCNLSTGACEAVAKTNGSACSDGDACTQSDSCQNGACVGADPVVCPGATDQCHLAGACIPATGLCSNPAKADGTACSDGDACTQSDTCQTGVCTAGAAVTCTASDQCHTAGTCDSTTGACSNPTKNDGASCSDGDA